MPLSERVCEWQARGESSEFRGYAIHTFHQPGPGPLLLLLHGFPSSSYDWRFLLKEEPERNVLAFDFLGFGLSDKPADHDYSLFWQADLAEELVRRHGGGRPVFVLAHDMGTSVANELMARDLIAVWLDVPIDTIAVTLEKSSEPAGPPASPWMHLKVWVDAAWCRLRGR